MFCSIILAQGCANVGSERVPDWSQLHAMCCLPRRTGIGVLLRLPATLAWFQPKSCNLLTPRE